ncbi:TIGR04290 family methyltransferase [Rhizobium sp. MC63]|uniref:TIGR04290 family methyltransferase n=1 Tax=Rhizobium mulingense TaxID=3031128 RepID=A0ACC6MTT1_9HYPH|nr:MULTISPECIES: TIGR04290 family methyltransferase [unclassified Rhizobium]MDF0697068.1 TIGR04290 family methyltransferase [Rhizobium sp. MC63]MEA3516734.1 TIGR04290 family methyltransferase [Rhizobium sp. MJ31]MEB3042428.1 TIGR04290 family methyltransferase [Rhizobium sp. MJ21]
MNEKARLESDIAALGPWFHNLRINGVQTAPDHFLGDYPSFKWAHFQQVVPEDLRGCSVLDIGCNAGFYSLEMKRRKAGRVVGIDSDPRYLRQAEFAARQIGEDIEFKLMSVYEVEKLKERFDLVLFMGVLYHLRHPLLALDLLHEHVVGENMLFQCMQRGEEEVAELSENYDFFDAAIFEQRGFPKVYFVEERYAGDPTNWFIPNKAAVEAMLRSAGFVIRANPEREVYLVERGTRHPMAEAPPMLG